MSSISFVSTDHFVDHDSCETTNGPAIQISLACSARAAATIVEMYRDDANITKTIQIVDVQKVLDLLLGISFK